jgi:lipase chaperone LimK
MNTRLKDHSRILRQCKNHETLLASALYLMTRYLQTGNRLLQDAVAAHLLALADHPDCPNACLATTARRLSEEWVAMLAAEAAGGRRVH